MTDYIKREDARGKLCSMCRWEGTDNCGECEHPIDDISAADVAEVVRCKNCLSWKKDAYGGVCDRYGVRLDKDWFCAGGEKREAQQ